MVQEKPKMAEGNKPYDRKGDKSRDRGAVEQRSEIHVGNISAGQAQEERFLRLNYSKASILSPKIENMKKLITIFIDR